MKERENKIVRWIYVTLVLLLFLPLIQYHFKLIKLEPLKGSFKKKKVEVPVLSINNLKNESFQENSSKNWSQNLGLKNWFVRVNNQLNYSLLNQSNTNGTIVCKDNYLITEPEIKAALGKDYIGDKEVEKLWKKIDFVNDALLQKGIKFMIMITPGKASTYRDKIPDHYFGLYESPQTNYAEFIKKAEELAIPIFDAKAIVANDKQFFEHPVFPKNGIHWSGNTVARVADTLVDYIESLTALQVADITLEPGELTVLNYRFTDYDIGEAMNLLWNISDDILHYPKMTFSNVPKKKINALGVGDSFIQSFFGFYPVLDSAFSKESNLWYYNQTTGWPLKQSQTGIAVNKLDFQKEIYSRDLILLEMTEENLKLKAFGFIDNLFAELKGENKLTDAMKPLLDKIMQGQKLVNQAKQLAPIAGYTIEEMKFALAKRILKNEWLKDFDYETEVQKLIKMMRNDKKWLQIVKEKAIRKNQSLEVTLRKDAEWMVNKKLSK